ncbi:hypothetical protein FKM82_026723 [Ascaphus truei]
MHLISDALLERVGVPYNASDLRRAIREGWGFLTMHLISDTLLERVGVPYNASDLRRAIREGWGSLQCI